MCIDEPIANDAGELVPPAADYCPLLAEEIGMGEEHSGSDAGEVAQVEYVVELGWRRRKIHYYYL